MNWKTSVVYVVSLIVVLAAMLTWLAFGGVFLYGSGKQFEFETRYMWFTLATLQFGMVLAFAVALGAVVTIARSVTSPDRVIAIANGSLGAFVACGALIVAGMTLNYTVESIDAIHMSLALTERWSRPTEYQEMSLPPSGSGPPAPAPPAEAAPAPPGP